MASETEKNKEWEYDKEAAKKKNFMKKFQMLLKHNIK
jgi:hypothetical protein